MASSLTCKSLVHFEFILVYDIRKWYSFSVCVLPLQFSQLHLLERLVTPLYILASFVID